ncbi:unnamed protein product [Brugia timori]|uniref:Ovule protein n=1 Tax=Brugia timori TaxID=42155 RepID=A0A0R3QBP6_9BILA|nr:unnamed protein product [Brugia timori]
MNTLAIETYSLYSFTIGCCMSQFRSLSSFSRCILCLKIGRLDIRCLNDPSCRRYRISLFKISAHCFKLSG